MFIYRKPFSFYGYHLDNPSKLKPRVFSNTTCWNNICHHTQNATTFLVRSASFIDKHMRRYALIQKCLIEIAYAHKVYLDNRLLVGGNNSKVVVVPKANT